MVRRWLDLDMFQDKDRMSHLLPIQALSFILLMLYAIGIGGLFISGTGLLISESLIFLRYRRDFRKVIFIWQAQVLMVAMVGLAFDPATFLNTTKVSGSVQIFLELSFILLESIAVVLFLYSERGVVWVLKGSTISLICIVLLILALVGSEGLLGFIENDPAKMLTSTQFNAAAQGGYTTTSKLTTMVSPYNLSASASDSNIHIRPNSNANLSFVISNTGALENDVDISVSTEPGIAFVSNSTGQIAIPVGQKVEESGHIITSSVGTYNLTATVVGLGGSTTRVKVTINVSPEGVDFTKDSASVYAQGIYSSTIAVPLGLTNTGTTNVSCVLRISAPDYFSSFLNIPEWNYTTASARISLSPGESADLNLIPRFLTAVDGTYNLVVSAYFDGDSTPIDNFTLTFYAESNRLVMSDLPGVIPTYHGTTTYWNMTIQVDGVSLVWLELNNVPQDIIVKGLINNTELTEVVGNEVPVYLDKNGSANLTLLVSTTESMIGHVSSFDIDIIQGGNTASFGILGFITGSALTTLIAVAIAVPVGLASAIFLALYCSKRWQKIIKPIMEVLIGVPSVIFGLWGAMTFGPLLAQSAYPLIDSSLGSIIPFFHGPYALGRSIMTASIVLAIMIFPIVMAMSFEAICAVPSELMDSSISLGATKWRTVRKVILKKARSGILGGSILAIGRALGETMAVLMIMQYSTAVPTSIFSNGATLTSAIAINFGAAYASDLNRHGLFSMALLLFLLVLVLNVVLVNVTKDEFWSRMRRRIRVIRNNFYDLVNKNETKNDHDGQPQNDIFDPVLLKSKFRRSKWLNYGDRVMTAILLTISSIMVALVVYILGDVLVRGGMYFSLNYLTSTQLSGGGFYNAISGSLMLIGLAILIATPLTLMAAIYLSEYAEQNSLLYRSTYLAVSTLSSTPSIVFGAFGFMLFVLYLHFGFSLLAGGLTLAFMVVPILFISNFEAIRAVPKSYKEASYALGVSKWRTVREIILPASAPAVSSGIIVGVGRVIGETAAVLLTAGFALFVTSSIADPVASMPVMIYQMYDVSAGNPALMQKMYAAAFLLIAMVVVLNIIGKVVSYRLSKKMKN